MSLRRKTIAVMSITLVGLLVLLYLVLRVIIVSSYGSLEQQGTLRNLNRVTNSLQDDVDNMLLALGDWSSWDETHAFVRTGNPEYVDVNLSDETLWGLRINVMMFVNSAQEIVYTKIVDVDDGTEQRHLEALESYAQDDPRFLHVISTTPISGYMVVAGDPMLIAARPVLHNDGAGPVAGTLVWGRYLDAQQLSSMSASLRLTISINSSDDPNLPADVVTAQNALSLASPQTTQPIDDDTINGYALLNDIYDQPSLILQTSQMRDIYRQSQVTLSLFVAALLIVGIVFGAGTLLLLERLILSPLAHLSARVHDIGMNDNFSVRLPVAGRDELGQLALAINTMLNTVTQWRSALQQLNTDLERRVTERTTELEDQKSQLQAIMDTMGEGLVYCVDGVIKYVNDAFVELLECQVRDLVGKPFNALTNHPDGEASARRYETTLTRQDGATVNVAITSMPVDEFDDRRRSVIIVRDITQELAAKQQKDYFFARASHDLRSPLTSIMTRLYLLGKKPEQLDTHLKILNAVSNHMLELVNDLLDVSRVEQGALILNPRDLVLQNVVDEVVEVQQADAELRQIQLVSSLIDTPLHVYGDPLRLNQVITNLVSNAIHYTPENGQITVSVEKDCIEGMRCAVIRVRDNGIGISPDNLDHVFDPFFRVNGNNENGSGLGLYIVKEIVKLHGGEVSVASEMGIGTTFSVFLTLSDSESSVGEPETTEHQHTVNQ